MFIALSQHMILLRTKKHGSVQYVHKTQLMPADGVHIFKYPFTRNILMYSYTYISKYLAKNVIYKKNLSCPYNYPKYIFILLLLTV